VCEAHGKAQFVSRIRRVAEVDEPPSKRVEIVGAEEAAILIADAEEIGRMLHGLIGSLERTSR
jgi:hypothetical protein